MAAFRSALGLSGTQIGEALGISRTVVSDWETERSSLRRPNALALQCLYGISAEWLLTGEGAMWAYDVAAGGPHASDIHRPVIEGAPSCGPGGEIQDPGPSAPRFAFRKESAEKMLRQSGGGTEEDLFFVRTIGDSMAPTLREGDIVALNANLGVRLRIRNNGIYMVRRSPEDPEARVKRVRMDLHRGQMLLGSDNRVYPTMTVDLNDTPLHQLILGRVVWLGRYLASDDPPESDW